MTLLRAVRSEPVTSCLAASGDKKDNVQKPWELCFGISMQGVNAKLTRSQVTRSCLG